MFFLAFSYDTMMVIVSHPSILVLFFSSQFNKEGGDVLRILDVESPKRNRSESVHRQVTPDNSRHHSAQQTLRRAIIVEVGKPRVFFSKKENCIRIFL